MIPITNLLIYATRDDWGANPLYPRLGHKVSRDKRTHVIIHHTVVVDADATKNIWENDEECFDKMQELQTIRPDLDMDVPYSFVAFPQFASTGWPRLLICEGRGLDRTGAHTTGHNTAGIGIALEGDWENYSGDLAPWCGLLGKFCRWLKVDKRMARLGSVNPTGPREVYGHRDFSQTACPGRYAWEDLSIIRFI